MCARRKPSDGKEAKERGACRPGAQRHPGGAATPACSPSEPQSPTSSRGAPLSSAGSSTRVGSLRGRGGRSSEWTWAEDLLIWLKCSFPVVQSVSGLNLGPVRSPKYFGCSHLWRASLPGQVIFGDLKRILQIFVNIEIMRKVFSATEIWRCSKSRT